MNENNETFYRNYQHLCYKRREIAEEKVLKEKNGLSDQIIEREEGKGKNLGKKNLIEIFIQLI